MIIHLYRQHRTDDIGREEECGICGEGFLTEAILASARTEDLDEVGMVCRACVAKLGTLWPDKFPTIEAFEAALQRFPEPIWNSIEEASAALEEGGPHYRATRPVG